MKRNIKRIDNRRFISSSFTQDLEETEFVLNLKNFETRALSAFSSVSYYDNASVCFCALSKMIQWCSILNIKETLIQH